MDLVSLSGSWSSESATVVKACHQDQLCKTKCCLQHPGPPPGLSSCRVKENTTWVPMFYAFPHKSELWSHSGHDQGLPSSIFGVHMDNDQRIVFWGLDRLQQSPSNTLCAMLQQRANIPICYHITRKWPSVPEGGSLPLLSHTGAAACFRICWLWARPR